MMTNLKGKFIVFDGGEGCGKTSQAQLLKEVLEKENLRPMLVRDPGTTRIGEMIRAILLDPDHDAASGTVRHHSADHHWRGSPGPPMMAMTSLPSTSMRTGESGLA